MGRRFGGTAGDCPVTEDVSDRLLRLPFHGHLTDADCTAWSTPSGHSGMSRSAPDTCERLPWDSDFFGVAIARVTHDAGHGRRSCIRGQSWAGHSSIDCLYFLADADHHESVRAAEENGFSLVDVRVTLERSVATGATADDDADVRLATVDDLPRLASIARTSHRNTRYPRDRHFDARRADEMYAIWIERAVRGELADAVWVIDRGDGPFGYLAASRDGRARPSASSRSTPPAGEPGTTGGWSRPRCAGPPARR